MFTNHNLPESLLKAVSEISSDNIFLPQDLLDAIPEIVQKLQTIPIYEDRRRLVSEAFNKIDKGYSDSIRIAFENEVCKKINSIGKSRS